MPQDPSNKIQKKENPKMERFSFISVPRPAEDFETPADTRTESERVNENINSDILTNIGKSWDTNSDREREQAIRKMSTSVVDWGRHPESMKAEFGKKEEPKKIKIKDDRTINPVTNQPLKPTHKKTGTYDEKTIRRVIRASIDNNMDPFRSLAIGVQETNLGMTDPNVGHSLLKMGPLTTKHVNDENAYKGNEYFEKMQILMLLDAINEKDAYARSLYKKFKVKPGDTTDFKTQAYQGLGMITPNTEKDYHTRTGRNTDKFYDVDVTKEPINSAKTLPYAKTINSLIPMLKRNEAVLKIYAQEEVDARIRAGKLKYNPDQEQINEKAKKILQDRKGQ